MNKLLCQKFDDHSNSISSMHFSKFGDGTCCILCVEAYIELSVICIPVIFKSIFSADFT